MARFYRTVIEQPAMPATITVGDAEFHCTVPGNRTVSGPLSKRQAERQAREHNLRACCCDPEMFVQEVVIDGDSSEPLRR